MNNYKIKVNDETESKEAQELFLELGFSNKTFRKLVVYNPFIYTPVPHAVLSYLVAKDGELIFADSTSKEWFESLTNIKELTLSQLRDLVVLKRNDVKDATHTCESNFKYICIENRWYLMTTDGWFQVSVNPKALKPIQTVQAVLNNLDELREEYKDYHQDQGLISGAEALRALADGKEVEFEHDSHGWVNCLGLNIEQVIGGLFKLRLKPQTIKLELKIPAPYKAKIGGRDDSSFVLNVGRHQYLYQNEDDYTKARNALEAVFDAALGGNNS